MIDEKDKKILNILQENSRTTNAEIARRVDMAPSAVLERIKKLEQNNIISKYSALLNFKAINYGLLAFVSVKSNGPVVDMGTAKELAKIEEVLEVHAVAGEDCFLVKLRVADTQHLSDVLRKKIAKIPNISSTSTTIVLETVKETNNVKLK